jgi:site-specific recombinase XerD
VIQDIAADWAVGGAETIARVRMTDPATYFRVVASILPKDVLVNVQHADFVFLSERKAPLSIDGAQKLIERLGVAAKLPFKIHAHMLRHAAGYALAARGVDTRTLQALMGHRSIANTVVYTAVADKRIRNIWGK